MKKQTASCYIWSVRMVEWFALRPDHEIPGSSPAGDEIQLMTVRRLIAQGFSLSPFRRLDMA